MKPAPRDAGMPAPFYRPCGCSQLWTAAPGGHKPECPENALRGGTDPPYRVPFPMPRVRAAVHHHQDRPPDVMDPSESEAAWWQNPRRLPWCAVCRKTVAKVDMVRRRDGTRTFTIICHGEIETTTLTEDEVSAMTGYGRAFAAEGVRDQ